MKIIPEIKLRDITEKSFEFNSLESLEDFINIQLSFWSGKLDLGRSNPTANQYIQRYDHFQRIKNQINAWRDSFESWDSATTFTQLKNLLDGNLSTSWLWSGHSFVQKWLDLNQISAHTADAFLEAVLQKTTSRMNQRFDCMQGYLIAYEYINQNDTNFNKRRDSEKKSIGLLRDQLESKNNSLINEVNEFQQDITNWKEETQNEFSSWYANKQQLNEDSVLAHSRSFHEQVANWTNRYIELENLFREKLRFEGAAKYWGDKAKVFRNQGYFWSGSLVVSLGIGIAVFSQYFLTWLQGQPSGLGVQSIEGVLIFAVIISSYAFLIKALSKLTFSSFHLMRDAEEREQLTHLYIKFARR
jgi:hypothetical protein